MLIVQEANPDARFCWRAGTIAPDICLCQHNNFVIFNIMNYTIEYYSETVRLEIDQLPSGMRVRYKHLTERMAIYGGNLGEPHTSAFGDGLFELRIKGADGIARVFYCTLSGKRIVVLHSFIKKTQKTPSAELKKAIARMKEVKHDW
uniref:type II toxin-antitoxin system RelE/ParE family toxin n=1 Tax=Salmonella enterica TaxID=28901 RepID=UPI003A92938A